jgi:hypothetical protein
LNTIVPEGVPQVGCVVLEAVGAAGGAGWALMTTGADNPEVQEAALVTVKLYVPGASPETVVPGVLPGIAPGLIIQFPAGNPLKTTLPVADAHVVCVMAPTTGAEGIGLTVAVTSSLVILSQPVTVWLAK